jgi:hypothetical protein
MPFELRVGFQPPPPQRIFQAQRIGQLRNSPASSPDSMTISHSARQCFK